MIIKQIRPTSEYEYFRTYELIKFKYNTKNPYELTKKIDEDNKIAICTKINRINTILSANLHNVVKIENGNELGEIRIIRDKLQDAYRKKMRDNNLTKKQQTIMNDISYEKLIELKTMLNNKKYNSNEDLKEFLLIVMIIIFPSRNDFRSLKIINDEKDNNNEFENYILINDSLCELILNYYKTSDKYKTRRLNINELKEEIQKYILLNPKNIYLFEHKNKPLTSARYSYELSQIFNKYLKYKITSTIIRKIDLSHKYEKIMEIMKKDNMIYGNSLNERIFTYINNNVNKNVKEN
jgi:hypothetical protein